VCNRQPAVIRLQHVHTLFYVNSKTANQVCSLFITANQIFWCDAATNNIEMADFDGQNRQLLVTVARKHFFGIAVDSQWIYTSSWKDR
jgi:hypothetical protein